MATQTHVLKMAFEFRLAGVNQQQVRNYVINNIWVPFRQKVADAASDAGGVTNISHESDVHVFQVAGVFEVYPKIVITFDSDHDTQTINTFLDDAIDRAFIFFKRQAESDHPTIEWVRRSKFKRSGVVRET